MSKAKIIELDETNTCDFCDNALAKYTCPKCQSKYCSLVCYQSEKHLQCSEEFYKNCIVEELAQQNDDKGKKKLLEILKRHHLEEDNESLDSDDDDDVADIADRLAGVNLDDADEVWKKLTKDEQLEFVAFLKSENVSKFIPPWEPWWCEDLKNIEELETCQQYKNKCPQIIKISNFWEISKKQPADCVKYNLINVLAAYSFTIRYFNGEHHDFSQEVISCVVSISLCLKNNQNFEDFETAIKSVEFQCIESDWILADGENFKLLRDDVEKILKGPNENERNFYVLCALSDLHCLLNSASQKKTDKKSGFSKSFPNDHFPEVKLESKNKIKTCLRKIDYLLSFAKDFTL